MNVGKLLAYSLLMLLLASCTPSTFDSSDELTKYLLEEKNGFVQHYNVGQEKLQLLYRPTDLLVAQEIGDGTLTYSHTVSDLREKYGNYVYFILTISKNDLESNVRETEFSEQLQNLSFRMADLVHLLTSKQDTIPLADFHYSRTYGMGDGAKTLLAFAKQDIINSNADWIEVVVSDIGIGYGVARFRFSKQILIDQPSLSW
jgi:hypothetical protein